jgi:hypothetical protein
VIEQGIFSLLSTDSGVSSLAGTRIYPIELPEGATLPALVYKDVGGSSSPTLSTSGAQRLRLELDAYGNSFADAANLRKAVITALNGFQGVLSDGTNLLTADLINPGLSFFDDEPRQFRCMAEFYLLYSL